MCTNPECIKTRRDLTEAWERILKMDQELRLINEALALLDRAAREVLANDKEARSV